MLMFFTYKNKTFLEMVVKYYEFYGTKSLQVYAAIKQSQSDNKNIKFKKWLTVIKENSKDMTS